RVLQGSVGLLPLLGATAVAVVELDQGAVGGGAVFGVHALAENSQVWTDRPLLGRGAVAFIDLDRVSVVGTGIGVVDAQARRHARDDRTGLARVGDGPDERRVATGTAHGIGSGDRHRAGARHGGGAGDQPG